MRRVEDGLFDRAARHGPITGSGPNFESAMRQFQARQDALARVGIWRCADNRRMYTSDGYYIDRDWEVIDL